MDFDVLVVGAGVSGLAAAEALTRRGSGLRVCIVEARDRIGGRIWTTVDRTHDLPFERGAEFVHGRPPTLERLLAREGLKLGDAEGVHLIRQRGTLHAGTRVYEEAVSLLAAAEPPDRSVVSWIRARTKGRSELGSTARLFAEGFYASDARKASALAIGEMQRAAAALDGDVVRRVLAGYDRVPQALLRRARAQGVELRLSSAVRAIRWSRRGIRVEGASPVSGAPFRLGARRALVTVPVGVLRSGAVRFSPALPRAVAATWRALEMGNVVKVQLRFRAPVWKRRFVFVHDPSGPFPTWWRPAPFDAPVLVGWAGGVAADALSPLAPDTLRERALTGLSRALGVSARTLGAALEGFEAIDWADDPWARGAYCVFPVGVPLSLPALAEPVGGTLHFAGEALAGGHAGTVHGAFDSGLRAARAIRRQLA